MYDRRPGGDDTAGWHEDERSGGLGHFAPYGTQDGRGNPDRRLIGFRHDYRPAVREVHSRAPVLE